MQSVQPSPTVTSLVDGDCAREPIHIPGSIQPHGMLMAISLSDWTVSRVSANAGPLLVKEPASVRGMPYGEAAIPSIRHLVTDELPARLSSPTVLQSITVSGLTYNVIAHRSGNFAVLEFEEIDSTQGETLDSLYPSIRGFMETVQGSADTAKLSQAVAEQVREITGFDRVMIYRFDPDWNGTVIAEHRNERLPSYLDLRFPASDIPAQARELYRANRQRLIVDADYSPVPLLGKAADPSLDMSFSVLRSVSPVHLEYMRNMGTASSMSISILVDGRLWGLISCHSAEPRRVPVHIRTACDFLAQMYSLHVQTSERNADAGERLERQAIQAKLLAFMAGETQYINGLINNPEQLLQFVDADGAAVVFEQKVTTLGAAPSESEVWKIIGWLANTQSQDEVFATSHLIGSMPEAAEFSGPTSGMLAVAISQIHRSYVLWFRKEIVQTVNWGGNPQKQELDDGRLHPRRSFDIWKETVRHSSLPWSPAQLDVAASLRNAVIGIVMRKAEELAVLTGELKQSNKELEAFSYSVSHDLRAPFRHIVGYAELLKEDEEIDLKDHGRRFVDTIIESAFSAGKLVDDLLGFSQMSRSTLSPIKVDMNRLAREVHRVLTVGPEHERIEWQIEKLSPAHGDPNMLRLVLQNLMENAIKYSRQSEKPVIRVWSERQGAETVYSVRDNGVGFDMEYVDKLFGVFQRLHRIEDYEGTGIGLANVKRMVERHHGRVWAEGEVGHGATFHFALPQSETE